MKTRNNKIIRAIKIFENNQNNNLLNNVYEGVILVDEYKRFEGVLYKDDNAFYINGYLGENVISLDMLGKSVNAIKRDDNSFLGVIDSDINEDEEIPAIVILSKIKENTFETDTLFNVIYLLKNDKVMVLERNLQK